ncbi:MAG: aspartate-semialdehyde dehydrogenase [Devosia sp.]|nr:aspartate-semialdehyde dehydrogenase [Devosia sp.]
MTPETAVLAEIEGYGLTTAKIIYRVPDHPHVLQDFLWQQYDIFPQFPTLRKFLAFWEERIEGPLHSITVAHARLIHPVELSPLAGRLRH